MTAMNPAWEPEMRFGPFGPGGKLRRRGGRPGPRPDVAALHAMARENGFDETDEPEGRPRRGGRGRRRGDGPAFGPGFGPGAFGPGPFGPGFGPGGPRPPFGPRRRRGRRTARGDVRLAVLTLVAEQSRHGYDIIAEIAARTEGRWSPSPGSVYPTISQLEDEGLVRTTKQDGRRVVELTEAGTAWVEEHREELDRVWESAVADDQPEPADQLWEQLAQLHAAAAQIAQAGTAEQIAEATAAITETRKAIYRLLAE